MEPVVVVQGKAYLRSRTVWLNILVAVGGTAAVLANVMPVKYSPYLTVATSLANLYMRQITTQPITSMVGNPAPMTIEKPGVG